MSDITKSLIDNRAMIIKLNNLVIHQAKTISELLRILNECIAAMEYEISQPGDPVVDWEARALKTHQEIMALLDNGPIND